MASTDMPAARSPMHRLRQKLARHGLWGMMSKFAADHIWRRDRFFVMAMDLSKADAEPRAGADEHYRIIKVEGIGDIPELHGWLAHRRGDFEQMIRDGAIGYMAMRGGVATGCMWLARRDFRDASLGTMVPVAQDEVFAFAFLIDHKMRRSGLGAKLALAVLLDIKRMGLRRVVTYCAEDNQASFRIMYWLGMRNTGQMLVVLRLFGRTVRSGLRHYDGKVPAGWRLPRRSVS